MQAQPFPQFTFTRLSNYNQLPSQATSFIFKDSKGFLWISTLEGLCRYDGKKITIYRNQSDNPNTIANNNVGNLAEDKEGNIWISQLKGISCFLPASNKFVNYYADSLNNGLSIGFNTIRIDTAGNIFNSQWGGTGIQYFDKAKKRFVPILIDTANDGLNNKNRSNREIGNLCGPAWDGSMYLISANGVFLFNPKTYTRTRVCGSSENDPIYIFKDKKGRLWLSEWNGGLSLVDEKTKSKKNVISNKHIGCITGYTDLNGKYWLLASDFSTSSIIVVDPETRQYHYQLLKIENEITSNMTPGTIYCDKEGRVFVTTVSGLLVSNPIQNTITNRFIYERGNPNDAGADDLVRSGCKLANGQYVFGILQHNGLRFYDSAFNFTKSIKHYLYAGNNHDLDVRNIFKIGPDNYLLSGQTGIGVLQKNNITPLQYVAKNKPNTDNMYSRARDMLPINDHEYWVRAAGLGICRFNTNKKIFTKTYQYTDKSNRTTLVNVRNIGYDEQGCLWANDAYHMYKYDSVKDEFLKLPVNEKVKYLNAIYAFCFNKNTLWLTGENGLLEYNMITQKETFFSTKDGLPNSITFKALVDNKNNVWVMHQTGVSMLESQTNIFKNYGQKDGFPIPFLETEGAFFMDDNNNLIVGNNGVVTKISVNQLRNIQVELPKVVITQIQGVDSSIAIETNPKNSKNILLSHQNFPVNILFSIIDFSTNGDRNYYYRYAGKDTTWLECEQGSVPINTNIPGNYTIQVTGKVNGMLAENIDQINFTILPQWYQTSICKIIFILLCIIILYLLYKWRINTARKTEMQKTEIQKLSAEQYKNQLELAQITNYFSSSLLNKTNVDDVLWDVAKNLIGKLGFEDCMIYLWNADKNKMVQKAGYGPKGSIEEIDKLPFNVVEGQGVVGYVMQTKEAVIISDTSKDYRYRQDEMFRLSELCVPIKYNDELIGIMDSEHHQKNFFTKRHLQLLNTIAALVANKIQSIESEQQVRQKILEVDAMSQQLKAAQLDALRSQMDPHFIFNSLNSIENFILKNERILASEYLGKFSKLIRNILDNSKKETVSIAQEIETLKIYIELERLRMNNAFEVEYKIEVGLNESDIEIPPMLMQPYVENAILHGIRYRSDGKGKLLVEIFVSSKQSLHYIVQDNGIGRTKAALENKGKKSGHQSYGTAITQSRIDIYNQLKSTQVTVATNDVTDENGQAAGTKVELIIPL